jgi:NAD(P)-dependent dehydrogenase (short-subunit alcohol dehydrogenase family)
MKRFEGKTILVTGAGSGIGAACVRRLVDEGASVIAADVRQADLDKVVADVAAGNRVHAILVDVTDRDQVAAAVTGAVKRFGSLDGLVNSAGIRGVSSVLDFEPDAWRRVLAVNLDGTFNACQFFARAVAQSGKPGAIVNITSAAGIMGVPNRFG